MFIVKETVHLNFNFRLIVLNSYVVKFVFTAFYIK